MYNGVTKQHLQRRRKMSRYTHFTLEERELSMVLIAQGFSLRAAARKLNRSPSSLFRELRRNSNKNGI